MGQYWICDHVLEIVMRMLANCLLFVLTGRHIERRA